MIRALALWVALVLTAALAAPLTAPPALAQDAPPTRLTIGYIDIDGDPRHEPIRGYERLVLKLREHPFAGAEVGLAEAEPVGRVLNVAFTLERIRVPDAEAVPEVVLQAHARGIQFLVVDAPAEVFRPLAAAVRGRDILIFNATAPEDWLRRELCAREVVHTLPSLAMSMDALVQHLVSRKWSSILMLQGPEPGDALAAKAFEQSAKKFGARIVERKSFTPGSDPRERDQNNPRLLTAGTRDYDVVFVADEAFEFARQVPYQTARARPVVGSIDLEPLAWHWTWERHGAPQLNSRFERNSGGRRMEGADWAALMGVRLVVKAAQATRSTAFGTLRDFILGGNGFDGAKGLAASVRPWDQQLRQAILLATPYAVAATAPVEGFLHKSNVLDTLGDDEGESPCRLDRRELLRQRP